jgi:hypothetical protein
MYTVEHGSSTARTFTLTEGRGLSVHVTFAVDGPRSRVAGIHYSLLDAVGDALAKGSLRVEAQPNVSVHRLRVALTARSIRKDPMWGAMLDLGQTVALRWRIELRGASDDLIARKTLAVEYRDW